MSWIVRTWALAGTSEGCLRNSLPALRSFRKLHRADLRFCRPIRLTSSVGYCVNDSQSKGGPFVRGSLETSARFQ
jgi:hypothetical protein